MILHPLLLAVVLSDLIGLLFLGTAVYQTYEVLNGWQPHASSPSQLNLERRVEMAGLYANLALLGFALGGLILLVAISHFLPSLVPGAMCGTGVLQAAGLAGWRALGFRLLAILVLVAARMIANLNQSTPTAPLALPLTKALLLALPLCGWTFWETARTFLGIDTHAPVSCCAVVYSQVETAGTGAAATMPALTPQAMVGLLAIVSGLMLVVAARTTHTQMSRSIAALLLATVILWLPLAGTVLLTHFSAYHFQVLAHHCPWCLFLPEHKMVGYPLLGALLMIAWEAPMPLLIRSLSRIYPDCAAKAAQRLRQTRIRILAGVALFWLIGGLPVLLWRLRYGVWMH